MPRMKKRPTSDPKGGEAKCPPMPEGPQRTPRFKKYGFRLDPFSVYNLDEVAEATGISKVELQEDCDNLLIRKSAHRAGQTFVSGSVLFHYLTKDDLPGANPAM